MEVFNICARIKRGESICVANFFCQCFTYPDGLKKILFPNNLLRLLLISLSCLSCCNALLDVEPTFIGLLDMPNTNGEKIDFNNTYKRVLSKETAGKLVNAVPLASVSGTSKNSEGGYVDLLHNLERSVAADSIKVTQSSTSTTKRSIPDMKYAPRITTVATPLLTTLRYLDKPSHQKQLNFHHRNYELDLERDHALPTSAPNADILKSNSNPTYPNPNRHHNHDRERHRHAFNSTPLPSQPNLMKKNTAQSPTIPMHPGDITLYSPSSRSFFTPPLPPEYQNPFADKPTLRGSNNEALVSNTGTLVNRRPIPPPSLMPGHERIPYRPPDLVTAGDVGASKPSDLSSLEVPENSPSRSSEDTEPNKGLNTPSNGNSDKSPINDIRYYDTIIKLSQQDLVNQSYGNSPLENDRSNHQEVLPSIRRILGGSNGKKGEIPEVLLKQVTSRPIVNYHQPPSSPVVIVDTTKKQSEREDNGIYSSNINKRKNISISEEYDFVSPREITDTVAIKLKSKMSTKSTENSNAHTGHYFDGANSTPSVDLASKDSVHAGATTSSTKSSTESNTPSFSSSSPSSSSSSSTATATSSTWTIAWNLHVYLSAILFTILTVYSFYKMLIYNKLTHLFSQSYFICIHLILIIICTFRIFYLCYDAYNIHSSFHIFVSELLLNLPATFLTVSFSVLILYLFRKSLNHKNNRYSALIRPLTVVVGCGVHVVLCITLHYVESYTMQNHQYHLYHHQQQLYRRQQQYQAYQQNPLNHLVDPMTSNEVLHYTSAPTQPPRVLSLICQIIYIFICLSLGLLYLYLYRILKRILHSKSQNYIHGYQNLSYGIHITIATALLFILLAAVQIFGAISISSTRALIAQTTVEIDWLQWGYQFSLRLIEIAIITLMTWVAGLKTNGSGGTVGIVNSDSHLGAGTSGGSGVFSSSIVGGNREKHSYHHNHSNVSGFFLPCTSSSSQEQFETDYPAVCNANTNLHTYTMRTGKLIYDDSFALNTLTGQPSQVGTRIDELQHQPTYQRPYETGSLHNSANHNVVDYTTQDNLSNNVGHVYSHDQHQYAEYLTDANTDHYENPNFDLRSSSVSNSSIQRFAKALSSSATTANNGGSRSSAVSKQQIVFLQNENCYSEPLQQNFNSSNYDFSIFERPKFSGNENSNKQSELLFDQNARHKRIGDKREKQMNATLDCSTYESPERRSSNSTHSCTSSSGGHYPSFNSFECRPSNSVRKSGTLSNIAGGIILHGRNISPSSANVSKAMQRASGIQTITSTERQQFHTHLSGMQHDVSSGRGYNQNIFEGSSNNSGSHVVKHPKQEEQLQQNSENHLLLLASNVEHTALMNNEDDSCSTKNRAKLDVTLTNKSVCPNFINSEHLGDNVEAQCNSLSLLTSHHHTNSGLDSAISSSSGMSSSTSDSASSGSMLVAEQGFVRFRALDDINNAQGVGIHNASIRNKIGSKVNSGTASSIVRPSIGKTMVESAT